MRRWALLLALVAAPSVAHAEEPRTIALHYDQALKDAGFPSPVLTAKIGDADVRFLVDSGAGVHTFAAWFVETAGLKAVREEDVHAADAGGNSIDVRILHDVRLGLGDGSALEIGEAAVANFPPMFEQLKIAGLLSPQLLATKTQAAVLDLVKPELRLETMESAVDRLPAMILNVGRMTNVCVNRGSRLTNRLYAIETSIDGVATSMTIDTGATSTTVREGIPAAVALRAKPGTGRTQMGVGGAAFRVFQSVPVPVDFGGGTRQLSIGVGPSASGCDAQGALGMDALKGCRWIFGQAAFAMSCVRSP
jgi:predicted aspartyl protease